MSFPVVIALALGCICTIAAGEQPGIWVECESGQGHNASGALAQASGGSRVGWFDRGKVLTLAFPVRDTLSAARLFLRYGRGDGSGEVVVRVLEDGKEPRLVGPLALPTTGGWDAFAWVSLPLGTLTPGTVRISLSVESEKSAGNVDVAVLAEDRWAGLWEPCNTFANGKPVDAGRILPAFAYQLTPKAYRGVFTTGSPVSFDLTAANRSTVEQAEGSFAWSVEGYTGKPLRTGSVRRPKLAAGATATIAVIVADAGVDGWSRLHLDVGGGEALDRQFAVIPAPLPRDRQASRFGLNTHGAVDGDWKLMADLGVGWVRGLSLWHMVQAWKPDERWQDKGYNWKDADHTLELAEANGIQIMGSLGFSVACASSRDPHHANWWGQSFHPIDDLTAQGPYAAYVTALTTRYSAKVKVWEQWNEPDLGCFWGGKPEEYPPMLASANASLHAADPKALLLNGGYSMTSGTGNVRAMLKSGITAHQQVIGIHDYNTSVRKIRTIKRMYRDAGATLPVWNTETGREPPIDEQTPVAQLLPAYREQAAELVRAYAYQLANGVDKVFWFNLAWDPYAMVVANGPRPALAAYRQTADLLDAPKPARYLGTLDLGAAARGTYAFAWKRDDGAGVIAFREPADATYGWGDLTVRVPVDAGASVEVRGIDGRLLPAPVTNGQLTITLDDEPRLIRLRGACAGLERALGWTRRYPDQDGVIASADLPSAAFRGIRVGASQLAKEVNGVRCAVTEKDVAGRDDNQRFYITLDFPSDLLWERSDGFGCFTEPVGLRLTYLDQGSNPITLQCAEGQPSVPRVNDGQWKTNTASIPAGAIPNLDVYCGIRLTAFGWGGGADLVVRTIELVRMSGR